MVVPVGLALAVAVKLQGVDDCVHHYVAETAEVVAMEVATVKEVARTVR